MLRSSRGCSLLEVLVATSIVAVGVAALAQLIAFGARANRFAGYTTRAAVLAQQKMEELVPEAATGLTPSPADALDRDVDGYSDVIDGAFARRWSIQPLPGSPNDTVVLQVLVVNARDPGSVRARIVCTRTRRGF
jgi:type II secretory pathway pseudopilin PulG